MATDDRFRLEAGEIERRIIAFVQRDLVAPGTSIGRGDDLLSGGLLDSIGVLRLAAFVQDEFSFKMPPGHFVVEHFRNVAALADYVRSAASAQPGSDSKR